MNFSIKTTAPSKIDADLLVIYTFEKADLESLAFSDSFVSIIKSACEKEEFGGKENQTLVLYTKGIISAYKILIMGLGDEKKFNLYKLRKAAAQSIKAAQKLKTKKMAVVFSSVWFRNLSP